MMERARPSRRPRARSGGLAALVIGCWLFVPFASTAQLIINEVDADTLGVDVLEFIELYDGGAGETPLDGLVVVLFNGSSDTSYRAIDLDGYATDASGYFVIGSQAVPPVALVIPDNAIQNGADAVALFAGDDADFPDGTPVTTTNLVDALVYGTDDPDDLELLVLLNADQPQVNEAGGGDQAGHSNQRFPNGAGGARNTDTYLQAAPTPGAANVLGGVDLLINEVDADTLGVDTLEFIELYDGGVGETSLDGFVVVLFNGSTDVSYRAIDLDGHATDASGYFVIGSQAVVPVDLVIPDNAIQNGADAVALFAGDDLDFPDGTPVTTTNLIDALVYGTDDPDDPELLVLLNADQPQVNEAGGGDQAGHSNQRFPDGAGGARNTDSYVQATPTPGAANVPEPPTEPLINEVDADTAGVDTLEFIELYDGGVGDTPLEGLVVVLFNGTTDAAYRAIDLDGHATDASGYFVIGNPAVVPPVDLVIPDNAIQNGADAVALFVGDEFDFPAGAPVTTTNLIDALVYGTDDPDDPELLTLLNAGQPQVNEAGGGDQAGHSNQRFPNGAGGARNTDTYVQATPTPGATNVPEPSAELLGATAILMLAAGRCYARSRRRLELRVLRSR